MRAQKWLKKKRKNHNDPKGRLFAEENISNKTEQKLENETEGPEQGRVN